MSNTQNSTQTQEAIKAIPDNETKTPNMPVGIYAQEGENLYHWCQTDKEELIAAGLNWELIEELPARCEALREAQSIWNSERHIKEEAEKEWKDKSPSAYELRDGLLHTFRYAFRKNSEMLAKVAVIAEGDGHADMIQDLNDLYVLGSKNTAPLTAIGFDSALLTQADTSAEAMAELLARANGERLEQGESKLVRDKAYTYLKQLVDEVRACGKYLFWKDKERLKGYRSEYVRKYNKRRDT